MEYQQNSTIQSGMSVPLPTADSLNSNNPQVSSKRATMQQSIIYTMHYFVRTTETHSKLLTRVCDQTTLHTTPGARNPIIPKAAAVQRCRTSSNFISPLATSTRLWRTPRQLHKIWQLSNWPPLRKFERKGAVGGQQQQPVTRLKCIGCAAAGCLLVRGSLQAKEQ